MQIDNHAAVLALQSANPAAAARYYRSPPWPVLSLAALLLLWHLSVPKPMVQLLDTTTDMADAIPNREPRAARLPPLHDNGWSPAP